ncbi:MAG TPA: hypothetical protein VHB21_21645 [Minicystis sp.]|nr:hypothetical protein [Minicystis sp.]
MTLRLRRPVDGHLPVAPPLAALALSALALGCAGNVATGTYDRCPVPVLLSRVDRVRAATPSPVKPTGSEDRLRAQAGISRTSSSNGYDSTAVGSRALTVEVLKMIPTAEDAADSDIRLQGVRAGATMSWASFDLWVAPDGEKVWVR